VNIYLTIGLVVLAYMLIWYSISLALKRNDVADIAWGLGFVVVSWVSFFLSPQTERGLLVAVLVTLWGARLSFHIFLRNKNKPEDFRYRNWRASWKNFYLRSFLQVFMLQGLFLCIISFPIIFIQHHHVIGLVWIDLVGTGIWIIGFLFESISDYQLKVFKSKPEYAGRIITTGLWRYSRHPNYFGEVVQWWGIFFFALPLSGGWITIVSPLTITYLIRYVSGVPMLERKYAGNAEFEQYKRETSVFFPLLPTR
jgi:steroid 5-alpha reductase family enzyme